ncbi:uncharacterized protein LOC130947476 isoform X1 [Arachis stenosperma]|uniref:uncharacterized protein LOC130947476 isoform X1 n=1 Tax=Arachis stenosperma TaxID=217475 RepID=UPI0025ABBF7D|nr:uncharacterized protein LOC130947476 isoform X1 [Arachis stenosperma]
MKSGGRSNRPQSSDPPPPPDEWVDGSWTVDCICGVTFDDGEEMVKCDECGVWVHTRCSRYVKGDDTFSCDKCKSKTAANTANATPNHHINHQIDTVVNGTEETEVAQFLIELPTKTISMENGNINNNHNNNNDNGSLSRRPFKLWTDIPMEERVHVQGVPGGDPALFGGSGLSSIFGPQLWKCTGYVPKKFNFRYREFPNWNDEDDDGGKGAGVLFSFSKETAAAAAAATATTVVARPPVGGALADMKGVGEERKGGLKDGEKVPSGVKKERSLLRPFVVHSSKQQRKKEEVGSSNSRDRSGKKRVRSSSEKEIDPKRRSSSHSSKSAFTPTSDAKPLEFYEDRGLKVSKDDTRSMKNKNSKDIVVQEHISNDCFAAGTIMEEPTNNMATTEDSSEPLYADTARHNFSIGDVLPEEKAGNRGPSLVEMPSKPDDAVTSVLKHNGVANASSKGKDGDCLAVDSPDNYFAVRSSIAPHGGGPCGSAPENIDKQVSQEIDCNLWPTSAKCDKREDGDKDNCRKLSNVHSSPVNDAKDNEKPSDNIYDIVKVNDAVITSLPSCVKKLSDVDRLSVVVTDDHTSKPEELSGICNRKQPVGSEGSIEPQKSISETKDGSESMKDPHKMSACLGKSSASPTSSTINAKSLAHDLKSEDIESPNPFTKQAVMSDSNIHLKKESSPSDAVRDEISRKSVRERPKSALNANSKGLHSSRSTQNSVSKQVNSDARDSVHTSLSKASLAHQTVSILGSSETNASLQHQKALQVQSKGSSSVPPKAEKINHTNMNTSSNKLNQNHGPSVNPSSTSNNSMLSDEELALLLHQELNSSPRVPRVPRARHAGSLPHLTSASSTSMLIKRTSSVGAKDHCLVSRRKYKDSSREGLSSSRELEEETKRIEKEKVPSSDQRKQDIVLAEDASEKEEGCGSLTAGNSCTNNASTTSAIAKSSPSSPPNDQNFPSMRNSPRNISDDDTASAGRPVHRTLPGLINDIMSKGRRMTYEELCNAVLPHWHNLRKHNGERYAYSSHSQAVLDCLRNRHEWARLVDRGPKTNSNRKRRKLDAEESDDNGYGKGRTTKEADGKNFKLQKEDFPKGKRKARKRRRLALQGRAVKDVRRRQKADSLSDEDTAGFSNSSEDSMFSEDEVGGIGPTGSTSDEAESA